MHRPSAWWRILARLLLPLSVIAGMAGCATPLPAIDRAAIDEQAIPLSKATTLGRIASESSPDAALSGFRLMPLGSFSLDARLQLVKRAEVSIDLQYYDFENDETGRWLLRALRDAADRGVRVRLLLDDFYTNGNDPLFLSFAAHKNVEVRIFNPFCCARARGQNTRFLASLNDFDRVNHRMHNKLFIADGAMAVIGGRNIANEYFTRGARDNFVDMDAFTVGWIVPPLEGLFDRYWNSDPVYPLEAIAHSPLDKPALRAWFDMATGPATTPPPEALPPNDILGYGPIADDLDDGRLGLIWGDAYVFADHPDKPFEGKAGGDLLETSVTYNLFEAIRTAKKSVVASSPYFVPGPNGMRMLGELRARHVDITVLTNSLASTDEPVVHLGYARYREDMLKMGIHLYELSTSKVKENKHMFLFNKSLGRLHAKLVVIDGQALFIGSMNLDPRSASINTEIGAVIKSPQLAKELTRVIDIDRLQSAYMVRIAANGKGLEWVGEGDDENNETGDGEDSMMVLRKEPDSTSWERFKQWFLTPFVPEEEL